MNDKTTGDKIQKALAAQGLGSRREIEKWIKSGRIMVNGRTATIGDRINFGDKVKFDGKPVTLLRPLKPK